MGKEKIHRTVPRRHSQRHRQNKAKYVRPEKEF